MFYQYNCDIQTAFVIQEIILKYDKVNFVVVMCHMVMQKCASQMHDISTQYRYLPSVLGQGRSNLNGEKLTVVEDQDNWSYLKLDFCKLNYNFIPLFVSDFDLEDGFSHTLGKCVLGQRQADLASETQDWLGRFKWFMKRI